MQGKKQYQEKLFTNFQLSDHIPADNFYRRLKEALPMQWLYAATKDHYGTEGQQSIDPVVFFKLTLVGYLENLCSDRRVINTASLRLDILYFIGYDIDEPLPWHSTLSRTRQLYGEDIFKQLFKKVLSQCIEKGMVAGKRQAIDSVAVKANASMDSLQKKEIMNDADDYVGALSENDDPSVKDANIIKLKNNKWINNTTNPILTGPISNSSLTSSTDKDARVSVKPGKARRLNYMAQVSVDTANHVITQIQSDFADKKDSQCLPSLIGNTIDNLREHGLKIEEVLADGNYSSAEALTALEDNNIKGYIPNLGQYRSTRDGFTYDKENDRFVCSQGKHLDAKNMRDSHGLGKKMKQYRSSSKDCNSCPIKSTCIGSNPQKTIAVTIEKELFERMNERLQTPKAKTLKKLRSSTVEPVLGTLVNFLGMHRINTKGMKQANKCMTMAAIAYDLKKLLKWKTLKIETMIRSQSKRVKNSSIWTASPDSGTYGQMIGFGRSH